MAVTVAELQVKVSADTSDAEKGLSSLGASIGSAGKALAGVATGAAIAGLAGLAAGLTASVVAAASFESQMSAIKAVSGATGDEMEQLSAQALQLGADTSFSASEAAQGMEELIKAGVSVGDVLGGAAAASLNLAAAGAVSVGDAAEIAANAMNQFNLTGGELGHVADLIAGAANASAIDVNDFKFSLAAVGAVANTVGFSFDDTAAAIALLGQAGIKGSDAGTSLKTMLLNLQPATDKQTALFRELGLITADGANAFFDATGKVKSMSEVAGTLQTALAGMSQQQKLATLETIFGSDAIRAAAVFATEGSEGFTAMAESMGKVTAAAVAAERLNNLRGDIEQLTGSLETAGIKIGTAFLPGLRSIVSGATELVNDTAPVLEAFAARASDAITEASRQISDAWGTARQAFEGKWLPSDQIPPFVDAVGQAATKARALADAADIAGQKLGTMGVAEDLGRLLATLATEAGRLRTELEGLQTSLETLHGAFGGTAGEATALGVALKAVTAVVDILVLMSGELIDTMLTMGRALVDFASLTVAAGRAVAALASGDIPAMNAALADGDQAFADLVTTAEGWATRTAERAQQAMSDVAGVVTSGMATTSSAVERGMGASAAAIDDGSLAMQSSMQTGMTGVVGAVTAAEPQAVAAATAMGTGMAGGIEAAAPQMAAAAESGAQGAVAAVSGQTGAASGAGQSLGAALGSGLEGGIMAYVGRVASAAAALVSSAIGAARAEAAVESPSKKTAAIGEEMAAGFEVGLAKSGLGDEMVKRVKDFVDATREYIPTGREIARVEDEIRRIRESSQRDALFRAEQMVTIDSEILRLKKEQAYAERDILGVRHDLAAASREVSAIEHGSLADRTAVLEMDGQRKALRLQMIDLEKELVGLDSGSKRAKTIAEQIDKLQDQDKLLALEADRIQTTNSLAATAARVRREGLDDQVSGQNRAIDAIKNQIEVLGAEQAIFSANEAVIKNATDNEVEYRQRLIEVFKSEALPLTDRIAAGLKLIDQLEKEGSISKELADKLREQAKQTTAATTATQGLETASQAVGPDLQTAAGKADEMAQQAADLARETAAASRQVDALSRSLGKLPDWFHPKGGKSLFEPRQAGGTVRPGGSYLVGEAGPELFAPSRAGTIVPFPRSVGSGGMSTVRVEVAVGGRVAKQVVIEGYDLAIRSGWTPAGLTG